MQRVLLALLLIVVSFGAIGCKDDNADAGKVEPSTVGDSPKAGEPMGNPKL